MPSRKPCVGERRQVVGVGRVAAVREQHARRLDALLGQHALHLEPGLRARVRVHHDGAPVCRCALATARRTRSTPPVSPWASMAHLRNAAFTSVPWQPTVRSRTNRSTIGSGSSGITPGPRCAKKCGTSVYV
jgi:hypothetical protein